MHRRVLIGVVSLSALAAATNCADVTNEGAPYDIGQLVNPHAKSDGGAGSTGDAATAGVAGAVPEPSPPTECRTAHTSELLPARTVTHIGAPLPDKRRVFVDDMFGLFKSLCGGCHVDGNQGGWQVTRMGKLGITSQSAREAFQSMERNDSLDKVMPPKSVGGKLAKDRSPDDPSNELYRMLKAYVSAKGPKYTYEESPVSDTTEASTSESTPDARLLSPYRMPPELANAQTTLGNCIPDKGLYATSTDKMLALDAVFETAIPQASGSLVEQIGLPRLLKDTDLFTFDAAELARHGVVAWAPAYPMFMDHARAIRHVRVPTGESIAFEPTTQQFRIPDMTRFYKTYLKPVVELDGTVRWRKMETQLIVAWQDDPSVEGYQAVTSVFGSYVWNEDETEAVLLTDPQKNGKAFRDRLWTYISDEVAAQKEIDVAKEKGWPDPGFGLVQNASHHYAIPGLRRCVECHMGSPSKNFVLGFQPLQVNRRPMGQGGIYEPAGADELTQLRRFIDYGLITGIKSADEIRKLEDSQGVRKPRNDYELKAQAYMLSACADCHSPRGSASEYNAQLKIDLDLQPSETGGIFEFPLDRYSNTIARGTNRTKIPYITPSLFDIPKYENGVASPFWAPKCDVKPYINPHEDTEVIAFLGSECSLAPWRSLIYRGVDAPFTYSDDLTLYPSMPMHTAGFDCRAPRFTAEWMLSIPAQRVASPNTLFEETQTKYLDSIQAGYASDQNPQPYVEVKPGDDGFVAAQAEAAERLAVYQGTKLESYSGLSRFEYCPYDKSSGTDDIVDIGVLRDSTKKSVPEDRDQAKSNKDGVPDNVHWVIYDSTTLPGAWYPRRGDWAKILESNQLPALDPKANHAVRAAYEHQRMVLEELQKTKLSDSMRVYAAKKQPMGLWVDKAGCDFIGVPKVSAFDKAPTAWMPKLSPRPSPDTPIYLISPGEYVYNQVCGHCHGPKADSAGREAISLATMTGGVATVTSFKTGIGLEENRINVFQSHASEAKSITAEDWAVRYYAWMGLGGTTQTIPTSIMTGVATDDVLGAVRPDFQPPKDANMLSSAEELCKWTLPANGESLKILPPNDTANTSTNVGLGGGDRLIDNYYGHDIDALTAQPLLTKILDSLKRVSHHPLLDVNGDEELWTRLCAFDNPRPIRVLSLRTLGDTSKSEKYLHYNPQDSLYAQEDYPTDAPVANDRGQVLDTVKSDYLGPWCIRMPSTDADRALLDGLREGWLREWQAINPGQTGALIPYCPTKSKSGKDYILPYESNEPGHKLLAGPRLTPEQLLRWSIRGAISAGLATYVYVDQVSQGLVKPTPAYDECEKRNK